MWRSVGAVRARGAGAGIVFGPLPAVRADVRVATAVPRACFKAAGTGAGAGAGTGAGTESRSGSTIERGEDRADESSTCFG
jgi:hypothetical protein